MFARVCRVVNQHKRLPMSMETYGYTFLAATGLRYMDRTFKNAPFAQDAAVGNLAWVTLYVLTELLEIASPLPSRNSYA